MVDDSIKRIYNTYLRITRTQEGKPFKYRKNFDKFEDDRLIYCNKIHNILSRHNHIDIDDFFNAPYEVTEQFTPSLQFYTTLPAIKCYTIAMKKKQDLPPDDDYHIENAKKSFKFITNYCIENAILVEDYLESDATVPHWLQHLKRRDVDLYALMAYNTLYDKIQNLDSDIAALFIEQIHENYLKYKKRFMNSSKMKKFVTAAIILCCNNVRRIHNK